MIVRMWEVKAHPEALSDVLSWVCDSAIPRMETNPLHITSEVFSSTDGRVVVISKWRSEAVDMGSPARYLITGPPHFWDFTPVDR